jgi:hypothetical protein
MSNVFAFYFSNPAFGRLNRLVLHSIDRSPYFSYNKGNGKFKQTNNQQNVSFERNETFSIALLLYFESYPRCIFLLSQYKPLETDSDWNVVMLFFTNILFFSSLTALANCIAVEFVPLLSASFPIVLARFQS